MQFLKDRKIQLTGAAALVLVAAAIGYFSLRNNESKVPYEDSSPRQLQGFTFFDIDKNSTYSEGLRSRLKERLGPGVREDMGLIDLRVNDLGFFKAHFPDLFRLHMQLNDEKGARIEHNIVKLTYRNARQKNLPFFYVELIFSNYSKNPLFFRIKSKKEGADIVDTIKEKYGEAAVIDPSGDNGRLLSWKKDRDHLILYITQDRFGDPEFHIMIYYVENIASFMAVEAKERKQREEATKKAGQTAF